MPPVRGSSVAILPIQRTRWSGSVQKRHTVSGVAAMWMSYSSASAAMASVAVGIAVDLPLGRFGGGLQVAEAVGPEAVEPRAKVLEAFRSCSIEPSRAVAALRDQARGAEDGEVLADGRPRHVEAGGDRAGGLLAVGEEGEDLTAAWLGDGM